MDRSLLAFSPVRAVAFFAWNAQSFSGRWARRTGMALITLLLPLFCLFSRSCALRMLYACLRGFSKDRLDLLGEEYFEYVLKPGLKPRGVERIQALGRAHPGLVLVSKSLDHIVQPLARHLGVEYVLTNRLEFRDGHATGRLLDPLILPRLWGGGNSQEPMNLAALAAGLGTRSEAQALQAAIQPSERAFLPSRHAVVRFDAGPGEDTFSVRRALAGKRLLLIGATGFIGKVWLANTLRDLPEIGKIYLLIRRQRSTTAVRRFEKIVEESPVFESFHDMYGSELPRFVAERIEILEGDVSQPGLGLNEEIQARLARELDLIINSAGLTDFNPDIRDALAINVDSLVHLMEFMRRTDHAALMHLSTCFVTGFRDGRIAEALRENYTPKPVSAFDVERERQWLHARVAEVERQSESPEVTEQLRRQARAKGARLSEALLESHVRKYRLRWVRNQMIEAGMSRARELHWQNTYCYTKSLGESLIVRMGAGLPIAVIRPSITETSTHQPFRGWNEGVNTSAPLSYLLGTYFRQLPTNERKCLDIIPVDLVSRGMTLIAAALVERRHKPLYHLATSACNPCNMRRSIELTSLAHRKFYRAQGGLEQWLRSRFDTIPVSKKRYQIFSAPRQRVMVRALRRLTSPIPFAYSSLVRRERDLERLEKLIELFEPFILLNEHVFEAQNIEILSAALVPEEKDKFGYDAHYIDWWEYWINIHVPALRKWTYPLIEGRPLESRPARSFRLDARSESMAAGN
ncbi:MAG: SDR family oxidoreductase [Acidobacteriia bacterium]|nr:SDR family oxidoreductase [Terriglobia bacterium]